MDVEIRELSGPDVTQQFLETLESLTDVQLTVEEALVLFRKRLHSGVRTYVACADGQVVGTLTLLVEQKFIHGGGVVGHIEDVAVHRSVQRQGVGAALVRHATEVAQRLGCYKVILNCLPDRVPFYEKLGYRKHDVGMRITLSHESPSRERSRRQ